MDAVSRERQSKKLIAAARYWAKGGSQNAEDSREDSQILGISFEEHQKWVAASGVDLSSSFEVWEENWETVLVFKALARSWVTERRDDGELIFREISKPSMESVINLMRIKKKKRPMMLAELILMEEAALVILLGLKNPDLYED